MENLICKFLLWKFGFTMGEDYNNTLDNLFLAHPESDILLELENCSADREAAFDVLYRYWVYECKEFSVVTFGKCLLENLKTAYQANIFSIEEFGRKCYSLWQMLPDDLQYVDPFHILSYADDPLSWGDEAQTREICEALFDFFREEMDR